MFFLELSDFHSKTFLFKPVKFTPSIMRIVLASFLLIIGFGSCKTAAHHVSKHESNEHPHWSYMGEEAPAHWSHLSNEYKDCGGRAQSPIDLSEDQTVDIKQAHNLKINYKSSGIDIVNNGHTVQFNIEKGNYIIFDGKRYELMQFHAHSLSEHTFDKQHEPLEIHFVNQAEDGTFAVIAVLFKEGAPSPFLEKFLPNLPKKEGEFTDADRFEINDVLPENTTHYYHYSGSFTTPPCTEIVEWIIMENENEASKKQLNQLHKLLKDNYRPVQPTNHRLIEHQ